MRTALLLFALLPTLSLSAQGTRVTGRIVDDRSAPIPFGQVRERKAASSQVVDSSGIFQLEVSRLPATLLASAPGYRQREIRVTGREGDTLLIQLRADKRTAFRPLPALALPPPATSTAQANTSEGQAAPAAGSTTSTGGRISLPGSLGTPAGGARLLTAAEVNDFKKWGLWADYTENDFRRWSSQWNLRFRNRYSVQVESSDRSPLPGLAVHLVSIDGRDTLWSAVTDNTGKAELWSDGDRNSPAPEVKLLCEGQALPHPLPFEQDVNLIRLKRSCDNRNLVDLAFVVDATGSMSDEIRFLQSDLQKIIGAVSEANRDIQLRTGAVFYRDRGDEYLTRGSELSSDPNTLLAFLSQQTARGGGDLPEAVEEGLYHAVNRLNWSENARTKILFLILDAHPHDEAKSEMAALMRQAAARGIRIVPVVCSGATKTLEYLMRCLALATNGSYLFLTDDSGIGNKHITATTDRFRVEYLHDAMLRLIDEMISVDGCGVRRKEPPVVKNPEVKVYPNPGRKVILESAVDILDILITDGTGKVIRRPTPAPRPAPQPTGGKPAPAPLPLDFAGLSNGWYLVRYQLTDRSWESQAVRIDSENQ